MKLALAQFNPTVGDLRGNCAKILATARAAARAGADLAVFPELCVSGYPPQDLVQTSGYAEANERLVQELAERSSELGLALIVGFCGRAEDSDLATNCLACLRDGGIDFRQQKILLPTYDVFDESRYFDPGRSPGLWEFGGVRFGLTICEDAWNDKQFWERSRYSRDPVEELAAAGMDALVNISASPYHMGKRSLRLEMIRAAATRHGVPACLVNQVGGNDQLLFDGSSFAVGPSGRLGACAASFSQDLQVWELGRENAIESPPWPECGDIGETEAVYDALVMGTKDYLAKCGFQRAIVGLSGGIDSSLTAAIAADALGPESITGVAMPGPYSSAGSLTDARATAAALGVRFKVVPIGPMHEAFLKELSPLLAEAPPGVAEENLQARIRGNILMALANQFEGLVLTTGNKSELAVGYCTIYGDMCGGLALISDVPKTMVYDLSRVANQRRPGAIPEAVLTKPPSAELRPNQKDSDSLPPYETLDPILQLYVEEGLSVAAIAERLRHEASFVAEIARKVDRNEYKRQQAAPGLRVTSKAFGMGRRFPIAQRYVR